MSPVRFLACGLIVILSGFAAAKSTAQDVSLEATLNALVKSGKIVGAQAVVGRGDRILIDHAVGRTVPGGGQKVNAETLFCIGSCSKPFASAAILSLVEDQKLELEQPVGKYLPAFDQLELPNNQRSRRAPTMTELLAHRSGIYSQQNGMTQRQARWIRDYDQTLEESVEGISREPLISPPGTEFAYSGAGYCVAGRVAEVVAGKPIEQIFQKRIAVPLRLKRTTFFPDKRDSNIAAGGRDGTANPTTPHLTEPELRLALVGGSLYSTARETARFLRMVVGRGKSGRNVVLKRDSWTTWTSRPYSDGTYGFGWYVTSPSPNKQPVVLSHSGSLASSRSNVRVVLSTGAYSAVHYTLAGNGGDAEQTIKNAITNAIRKARTSR